MTPRGGKRDNAGRKPLPPGERRVKLAHTLDPANLAWLTEQAAAREVSRSDFLNEVVASAQQGATVADLGPPLLSPADVDWLDGYAQKVGRAPDEALASILGGFREMNAGWQSQSAANVRPGTLDLPEDVWETLKRVARKFGDTTSVAARRLIRLGAGALGEFRE